MKFRVASSSDKKVYFGVVDKYSASSIGYEKTRTSTLFFNSDKEISQKQLQRDFGGIEILSFDEEKLD